MYVIVDMERSNADTMAHFIAVALLFSFAGCCNIPVATIPASQPSDTPQDDGMGRDDGPANFFTSGPTTGPGSPLFRMSKKAHRIVFVVSLPIREKNEPAGKVLMDVIRRLPPNKSFDLIFVTAAKLDVWGDNLVPATEGNQRAAVQFLKQQGSGARSDLLPALTAAFRLNPDIICVLTGDDFPEFKRNLKEIGDLNKDRKVQIHITSVVDPKTNETGYTDYLQAITKENGGVFRFFDPEEF
ncbi:MAG TPA: hypothetical protein VFE47_23800 [Tepidisphaeraceae bacterium]|jgi:hypothetical protein|nr:hypothetical protein [Tepidisphaeraceae bacterium]